MKRRNRSEKGAIIVEASLVLPIFMFAIIAILFIVNLCTAQAKIQIAINNTAKEISQYSYLYSLTGINNFQADAYEKGEASAGTANQFIDGFKDFTSNMENGLSGDMDYSNISDVIKNCGNDYKSMEEALKTISDDPKSFAMGFAYALADEGIEHIKSQLAVPMARMLCKKHLSAGDIPPEQYLKKLGIVPKNGSYYDGIDFSSSRLFPHGTDNSIIIVAKYQLQVINILGIDIKFNFVQTASTTGWCTSSDSSK